MSAQYLLALAALDSFRPTSRFDLLAGDHVPFDDLTGQDRYEQLLINRVAGCAGCESGGVWPTSLDRPTSATRFVRS